MSKGSSECGAVGFHLLMIFLTGGIWLVVLIVMACVNSMKK